MFSNDIHLHSNLIFVDKARSLQLYLVRGSSLSGSSLASKYKTTVNVNGSGKHCSLLRSYNNYRRKMFYSSGPRRLFMSTKVPCLKSKAPSKDENGCQDQLLKQGEPES